MQVWCGVNICGRITETAAVMAGCMSAKRTSPAVDACRRVQHDVDFLGRISGVSMINFCERALTKMDSYDMGFGFDAHVTGLQRSK